MRAFIWFFWSLFREILWLLLSIWVIAAILLSPVFPAEERQMVAAGAFGVTVLVLFAKCFFSRSMARLTMSLWALGAGAFFFGYYLLVPEMSRNWSPEVARLPWAEREGDMVRIHDIRNFHYKTETDFKEEYYTKDFDLNALSSVDLVTSYWSSDHIAHVILTFGFEGKDYVSFSIETRKEATEEYSTLGGFFRNYELIYVVADERDILGLRTKIRQPNENVYLWPLDITKEKAKIFFLRYIDQVNALKKKPAWYNTLTTNCTTAVLGLAANLDVNLRYSWKILLSGHTPAYLYEIGSLDQTVSFDTLKARSWINEKSNAAFGRENYSQLIRGSGLSSTLEEATPESTVVEVASPVPWL